MSFRYFWSVHSIEAEIFVTTGNFALHFSPEINECEPNPCKHDGTCYDGIGEYTCVCPIGYTGVRCENGRYKILRRQNPTKVTHLWINLHSANMTQGTPIRSNRFSGESLISLKCKIVFAKFLLRIWTNQTPSGSRDYVFLLRYCPWTETII